MFTTIRLSSISPFCNFGDLFQRQSSRIFVSLALLLALVPPTARTIAQTPAGDDVDLRDNEIAVPFLPSVSTAPPLPSTRPVDRALVLQIGSNRFAGSNLTRPSYSPDGREIVVANTSETHVFDAATGVLRTTLPPALETIFSGPDTFVQRSSNEINVVTREGVVLHTLKLLWPEKMAVSRDGKRLAVATAWIRPQPGIKGKTPEPSVTLWNLESGEQIADLGPVFHKTQPVRGQPNAFWMLGSGTSVAFDATDTLMTVSADAHIKLWNAGDGKTKSCADITVDPAMPIAFAPDGKSIVLPENQPRQIDLASGVSTLMPFTLPTPQGGKRPTSAPTTRRARRTPFTRYGQFSFSSDGRTLCYAWQGTFHRWDMRSKQELRPIDRMTLGIDAALSPDGRFVAITSFGQLDVFATDTGLNQFADAVPRDTVRSMSATRDGSGLIVGDAVGSIYRFDAGTGELQAWRKPRSTTVPSLFPAESFANGATGAIWAFSTNSTVCERDAKTLAPTAGPTLLTLVPPYAVASDGLIAAGYSVDNCYEFAPLAAPALTMMSTVDFRGQLPRSANLAISPDHTRLALAAPYRITVIRSDRKDAEQVTQHFLAAPGSRDGEQPADVKAIDLPAVFACDIIRYSPDGKQLFGISRDGPIAFNTDEFSVLWLSKDEFHLPHARTMAISDDGRLMAFVGDDGVSIVDTDGGRPVTTLHALPEPIRMMEFIPGTTRIAVLGDGRSIDIWDWRQSILSPATESTTRPASSIDAISSDQPAEAYAALFAVMEKPAVLYELASSINKAAAPDPFIKLIDGLSSSDAPTREHAHHELERAGAPAAADIRRALEHTPSGEAHDRLQSLSDLLDAAAPENADADVRVDPAVKLRRRTARLIEALDWIHSPQSLSKLCELAIGPDADARLLATIALTHTAQATTRP